MSQQKRDVAADLSSHRTVAYADLPDLELYMDQVVTYAQKQLELHQSAQSERLVTPAILSNSVKSGLIPRPVKKKYERRHLSAFLMACTLKQVFPVQQVEQLLKFYDIDERDRFDAFGCMQDAALKRVSEDLHDAEDDRQRMCERILQLTLTANANRLAARLLLEQLAEQSDKDKPEKRDEE